MDLVDPLPKGCWNSLQVLVHAFAAANDCVVLRTKKQGERSYLADISIKNRIRSKEMDNNPFQMEEWISGSQRRKEEFMKRLRDKGLEEACLDDAQKTQSKKI